MGFSFRKEVAEVMVDLLLVLVYQHPGIREKTGIVDEK